MIDRLSTTFLDEFYLGAYFYSFKINAGRNKPILYLAFSPQSVAATILG